VDLLILLGDDIGKDLPGSEIEAFVQLLWDAGFYLGHSVRTVSECAEDALQDVVTTTTFMESRLLAGSRPLLLEMLGGISTDRMWGGKEFFEAKFEEQKQRHARFHETAYNLEPNIKEGPGGLRDIQMISWVARRHLGAAGALCTAPAGEPFGRSAAVRLSATDCRTLWLRGQRYQPGRRTIHAALLPHSHAPGTP
jgi:[protein-PII] uridylyltransferase